MAVGFILGVLAYPSPQTEGVVVERVLPFVVAMAIASPWAWRRSPAQDIAA